MNLYVYIYMYRFKLFVNNYLMCLFSWLYMQFYFMKMFLIYVK